MQSNEIEIFLSVNRGEVEEIMQIKIEINWIIGE